MNAREYLELVEQLLRVLASQFDPEPETVKQLHQRYCEVIEEVNERLRRCEELLQDGFRSEAIQECERRPNLLEAVAALDFPEAEVWSDYATQFGLPPAPELLVEVAADLNDAYLVNSSLEELMVRYRLLNLARSPLKARLSVLQRIAASDQGNSAWTRDLEVFEKARFQEIHKELAAAIQKKNLAALTRLRRELTSQPWQTPPPQQLMDRLDQAWRRQRKSQARRKLQKLAQALHEAFNASDLETAQTLRRQWHALAEVTELAPEDPLWTEAAPAFQWLEEQDEQELLQQEHQRAVAQLEQLLNSGTSDALQLEQAIYQATKDGFELPEHLAQRAHRRLEAIQRSARRRVRAVVLSVSLVVVLLAGGIGFVVHRQVQARQIEQHANVVKSLLEQGQLLEAQEHLQRLERETPTVFQAPAIRRLQAEVRQKLEDDARRVAELEQLLDAVRRVVQASPHWTNLQQAQKDLRKARSLCKTADETADVLQLQQQVRDVEMRLRQEADSRFSRDLESLVQQEKKLAGDDPAALEELLEQAESLKKRPHVSLELVRQGSALQALIDRLQDRLQAARQWQRRQQALDEITQAVGSVAAYRAALHSYARLFPQDSRSGNFKRLAEQQAACWEAMLSWNDVARVWEQLDVTKANVATARNRLRHLQQLQEQSRRFPILARLHEPLASRVEYLKSVLARYNFQDEPITQTLIRNWFQQPEMRDLSMIQTKDGTRYYMLQKPRLGENAVVIRYWRDPSGENERTKTIPLNQIANPRAGSTFVWESPQASFVPKGVRILAKAGPGTWESAFLQLEAEARKADMDPLITVFFLKAVMETGSRGSTALDQAWKPSRSLIESASLDPTVNWINPRDEQAALERERARKLLAQLPESQQVAQEVQQRLQALRRPLRFARIRWVGWLYRGMDKQWQCGLKETHSRLSGTLAVLDGDSPQRPSRWLPVARLEQNKIHWKLQGSETLLDGMPVYLLLEPETMNP